MWRGILSAVLLGSLSWWLFSEWPTLAPTFAATVEEAREEPYRPVYPLVLGGILVGLFLAFAWKGLGFWQNRTLFGRLGLALFSIYVGFCVTAQEIALSQTRRFAQERGIVVWKRAASRMGFTSLVGPLRWTGLVVAPEGVYQGQISPFGGRSPTFTLFPSTTENAFVAKSRSIELAQRFLSQARFPVTRYRVEEGQSHGRISRLRPLMEAPAPCGAE